MKGFKIAFDPDVHKCISCRHFRVVDVTDVYGVKGFCLNSLDNEIVFFGDDQCVRWEENPAGYIYHEQ